MVKEECMIWPGAKILFRNQDRLKGRSQAQKVYFVIGPPKGVSVRNNHQQQSTTQFAMYVMLLSSGEFNFFSFFYSFFLHAILHKKLTSFLTLVFSSLLPRFFILVCKVFILDLFFVLGF